MNEMSEYINKLEKYLVTMAKVFTHSNGDIRIIENENIFSKTIRLDVSQIAQFARAIEVCKVFPSNDPRGCKFWENVERQVSDEKIFKRSDKITTRIVISFKSEHQSPDFMIIKETYIDGKIDNAQILYEEKKLTSDLVVQGEIVFEKVTNIKPIL